MVNVHTDLYLLKPIAHDSFNPLTYSEHGFLIGNMANHFNRISKFLKKQYNLLTKY